MFTLKTPIKILFEDADLLIADKPADLVCHSTHDKNRPNLLSLLKAQTQMELILLHRLDVATSGAIILCKNSEINLKMQEQIKNHDIVKIYWAAGEVTKTQIDLGIEKARNQIMTTNDYVAFKNYLVIKKENKIEISVPTKSGGSVALSKVKLIQKNSTYCTFQLQILTGRKHQIRSHLKTLGWPILGDKIYNNRSRIDFPRLALHSWQLRFYHPNTNELLQIESPIPDSLRSLL